MRQDNLCGLSCWHPKWLQPFANTKYFIAVYGLLGTVQAMSYMYFIVTLTTLEKRFKIPSQTTGIVLSGNEISQILLSLILSYVGGQRNRPRWIAWGMVCCSISCFIIALPHFLYGSGDELYHLTKEYLDFNYFNSTITTAESEMYNNSTSILPKINVKDPKNLCDGNSVNVECNDLISMLPLILIFLSQFVLGIGNTLYYSLGQTYLDDNTKKTNTPIMLAFAMSLRMIGPIFGFFLGYASLNMFIDPNMTPLINKNDPRWLGAWWFGWIILGSFMLLFSGLVGVFPKELPKRTVKKQSSELPKSLKADLFTEERIELGHNFQSNSALDKPIVTATEFAEFKDFPKALLRLLKTKLLIFNIISGIFYILGAAGFMTFLTKYMEVQFHKNPQDATIFVGPITIMGMVFGFIASGVIISKKKPSASKVLFWNVIVGVFFMLGQFSNLFWYCDDGSQSMSHGVFNLTKDCNANCACESVSYNPVCNLQTKTTFFSPCHAGCKSWDSDKKVYSDCSCINSNSSGTIPSYFTQNFPIDSETPTLVSESSIDFSLIPGACIEGCAFYFYGSSIVAMITNLLGSSGRIGNVLVNYRSVQTKDKSFAQGLALMLVSLFALIPAPIIFGRIIDSTCLVWSEKCGKIGNCQFYDQTKFRYYINFAALFLTFFGVFFDALVWYYGRHLDLYGDNEQQRLEELKQKNRAISPLLDRKNVE